MNEIATNLTEFIESLLIQDGYPIEKHKVTTEDGYINTIYRIPHGKEVSKPKTLGPPVILIHGLSCSCAEFVNQSNLAHYLVDQGFDVWLPNNRGSTLSQEHVRFDPNINKDKYWNYSWHEIGVYDNVAFTDYVLDRTDNKKVIFIGHSQGVNSILVQLSEKPDYNEKIALSILMSPPVYFNSFNSIFARFLALTFIIFQILQDWLNLPIYQFKCLTQFKKLGEYVEPQDKFLQKFALLTLYLVAGYSNYEQTENLDFRKFTITTPNCSSMKQYYHFAQIIYNKRFSQYDHGRKKNVKIYGTDVPPLYDLSGISSPTAIFYGENDMYCHPKDIEKLQDELGNLVHTHKVRQNFNHIDFLMGKDSKELVYKPMVELMMKYTT